MIRTGQDVFREGVPEWPVFLGCFENRSQILEGWDKHVERLDASLNSVLGSEPRSTDVSTDIIPFDKHRSFE
jgi:hypothetical protein